MHAQVKQLARLRARDLSSPGAIRAVNDVLAEVESMASEAPAGALESGAVKAVADSVTALAAFSESPKRAAFDANDGLLYSALEILLDVSTQDLGGDSETKLSEILHSKLGVLTKLMLGRGHDIECRAPRVGAETGAAPQRSQRGSQRAELAAQATRTDERVTPPRAGCRTAPHGGGHEAQVSPAGE